MEFRRPEGLYEALFLVHVQKQAVLRPRLKKPFHAVRFPHIDAYIVLIVIGGQEIPLPLPGKDDGVAPALEQGEGKFPAADPPRHGIDAGSPEVYPFHIPRDCLHICGTVRIHSLCLNGCQLLRSMDANRVRQADFGIVHLRPALHDTITEGAADLHAAAHYCLPLHNVALLWDILCLRPQSLPLLPAFLHQQGRLEFLKIYGSPEQGMALFPCPVRQDSIVSGCQDQDAGIFHVLGDDGILPGNLCFREQDSIVSMERKVPLSVHAVCQMNAVCQSLRIIPGGRAPGIGQKPCTFFLISYHIRISFYWLPI